MDFNFKQNQQGNREPVKILGEELERVTHFKYLGMSMEEEGGMETEITKRVGAGWRNWNMITSKTEHNFQYKIFTPKFQMYVNILAKRLIT